jgi:hypothetical protein
MRTGDMGSDKRDLMTGDKRDLMTGDKRDLMTGDKRDLMTGDMGSDDWGYGIWWLGINGMGGLVYCLWELGCGAWRQTNIWIVMIWEIYGLKPVNIGDTRKVRLYEV